MICRYNGYLVRRTFPKDEGAAYKLLVIDERPAKEKTVHTINNVDASNRPDKIQEAKDWIDKMQDIAWPINLY